MPKPYSRCPAWVRALPVLLSESPRLPPEAPLLRSFPLRSQHSQPAGGRDRLVCRQACRLCASDLGWAVSGRPAGMNIVM